jgi:hypothetical protein
MRCGFIKKGKRVGFLEPGTDPAPPANWRSPVKTVVTPTTSMPPALSRPPSFSPLTTAPLHPSPERQEQRACETPSPLRPDDPAVPGRRSAPLGRRGRDTYLGSVGQDPPCVFFATAAACQSARPNRRRASNKASTITVHTDYLTARGLPIGLFPCVAPCHCRHLARKAEFD